MQEFTKLQKQVFEYDKKYGWLNDKIAHILLHMQEELGEISRRILRYEEYKKENFSIEELSQEITDLLYLTFKLANKFQINLDYEWENMWKRYENKVNRQVKEGEQ